MKKYKSMEEWLEELAKRESSGNYSAVNNYGYLGKYQMGEAALSDVGYYKGHSRSNNQEWKGKFSGKDGVFSREDFLHNQQAQENAIRDYMKKQWSYIKNDKLTNYVGSNINGIDITESGLLGGAHLKGLGGVGKYLRSNGKVQPTDANGTNVEEYIKKFGGYDVSEITDPTYYSPKWNQTQSDYVGQKSTQGANMIGQVAQKVNPQSQMSDNNLKDTPIQPPLSREEWMKRLKRQRMGLL